MKIVTVVGNRPQFIKAAAVSTHLRRHAEEVLVNTGQHYDRELASVFFEELDVPPPDHELGVGSGSHAVQTATTMTRLEPVLMEESPDAVLVYGDTNATLAGAIVAAKLVIPTVHVEAGMRSFDWRMPEEVNRLTADRLCGLLLCATRTAVDNLGTMGLEARVRLVGDVMTDVAVELGPVARRRSDAPERLGVSRGEYVLATAHRAGNVDDPTELAKLVSVLDAAARQSARLVFPVHPRTRARLGAAGLWRRLEGIDGLVLCEPLGYLDFACLLWEARAVLTDSGGVQKEAYVAGVPCVTLREETEWVETVESGMNRLVGLDAKRAVAALSNRGGKRADPDLAALGGGMAGRRCAEEIAAWLSD